MKTKNPPEAWHEAQSRIMAEAQANVERLQAMPDSELAGLLRDLAGKDAYHLPVDYGQKLIAEALARLLTME